MAERGMDAETFAVLVRAAGHPLDPERCRHLASQFSDIFADLARLAGLDLAGLEPPPPFAVPGAPPASGREGGRP